MKRRRLTAAQRLAGPDTVRRTLGLRTEPLNQAFAGLPAPTPTEIARQIAPTRVRGPRIRTSNFDAILASSPNDIVAARVVSRRRQ